jgi:predicted ester cyclase
MQLPASHPQTLTEAEARVIVAPWYSLFTVPGRDDVRAVFDRAIAQDFEGRTGDHADERRDREETIDLIDGLGQLIPDMTFEIKELFVSDNRVIVRGETIGTPAQEFFGVRHTGRRFQIMSIDILTIENGMITKAYHLENWLGALDQLRAGN